MREHSASLVLHFTSHSQQNTKKVTVIFLSFFVLYAQKVTSTRVEARVILFCFVTVTTCESGSRGGVGRECIQSGKPEFQHDKLTWQISISENRFAIFLCVKVLWLGCVSLCETVMATRQRPVLILL